MNKIKQIILFGIAVLMCSCQSKQMEPSAEAVSVPLGGNTYVTAGKESAKVSTDGIKSWTGTDAVLSAWFKTSQPGDLNLFLKGKAADGPSTVKVTFGGKSFTVKVNGSRGNGYSGREGIRYGTGVYPCRFAGRRERRRSVCQYLRTADRRAGCAGASLFCA